jgi:hypothetical protein
MPGVSRCVTITPRIGACTLFLSVLIFLGLSSAKSDSSPRIILEVINRHFTMGRKIPSVYLRVFSDGTAECHTVKYAGDEAEIVKKEKLTQEELRGLKTLIDTPGLLNVKKRYELMYMVVDSWMEWNIKVPHKSGAQKIQVLNFSPRSAREKNQPYPDALVKLGCSIWKLRHEVYGDEPYYLNDDCKKALEIGHSELFLNDFFAGLHEFGLGFDAQTPGVVKQFVNALVGDLPVEQFADTGLRLSEDHLQVLL